MERIRGEREDHEREGCVMQRMESRRLLEDEEAMDMSRRQDDDDDDDDDVDR